jgi:hypothetical protein
MASFSLVDLVLFFMNKLYTRYVPYAMCDLAMWCFISCFGSYKCDERLPSDTIEVSGCCNVVPKHSLLSSCVLCIVFSG